MPSQISIAAYREIHLRLNSLQVCRGIAASLVVLLHYTLIANEHLGAKPLAGFFYFGWAGVDFFFVLSGFIIAYINKKHIGNIAQLKPYLVKRVIRIYPIYWPILIAMTTLLLIFGRSKTSIIAPIDLHYFIASFFLASYKSRPILPVAWTLVFEVFFYAMYSVMFINKKLGEYLFVTWAGVILLNLIIVKIPTHNSFILFVLSFHNLEFLLGCAAAWVFCEHRDVIKKPVTLIITGAALFLYAGVCSTYPNVTGFVLSPNIIQCAMPLASFMIILGLAKRESIAPIPIAKLPLLIGESSYNLYLIHPLVLATFVRSVTLFIPHKYLTLYPVGLVDLTLVIAYTLAVTAGILYYCYYDIPVRGYLRKRLLRQDTHAEPANTLAKA